MRTVFLFGPSMGQLIAIALGANLADPRDKPITIGTPFVNDVGVWIRTVFDGSGSIDERAVLVPNGAAVAGYGADEFWIFEDADPAFFEPVMQARARVTRPKLIRDWR